MNLHLYLPPTSAHPPDTLRSLIFGRVRAYYLHNTNRNNFLKECATLASNLLKRGWEWDHLKKYFIEAERDLSIKGKPKMLQDSLKTRRQKNKESKALKVIVFKLPYHPRGVTRQDINKAYRKSGLADLQPDRRFICAQLRPYNLRDRLCSTALRSVPDKEPSKYLSSNIND